MGNGKIAADELRASGNVVEGSGGEIVDNTNCQTVRKQSGGEMRSDKSRPARYENHCHKSYPGAAGLVRS